MSKVWRYLTVGAAFELVRALMLWAAAGAPWYRNGQDIWTDVNLYHSWTVTVLAGGLPHDTFWQYPPGAAFAAIVAASDNAHTVFAAAVLIADVVALVALLRAAETSKRWTGVWLWVAAPAVVGPAWFARFDVFVGVLALCAILAYAKHPKVAGALIGVGVWIKVWPVLLLATSPAGRRRPVAVGFAAVSVVCAVGFYLLFGSDVFTFVGNQGARGIQIESVVALPAMVVGAGQAQFRYGAVELDYPYGEQVAAVALTVGVVAVAVLWRRWWSKRSDANPADIAVVSVLVLLCVSPVLSPQYLIWLVAVLAAAATFTGTRLTMMVPGVVVAGCAGQIVYPMFYTSYCYGVGWVVAVHLVEILLLLWMAAAGYVKVWSRGPRTAANLHRSSG